MSKKNLAILLSKIKVFEDPSIKLEQYQTDSEIAAESLWFAYMSGDIKGKVIADLGCGTGIFGIGALILGAEKVYFIDVDSKALEIAKQNKKFIEKETGKKFKCVFMNRDIRGFYTKVDVVIQNPPFGVVKTHTDKLFLIKAMEIADRIYSFHKMESEKFLNKFLGENNFRVVKIKRFNFPLRKTLFFHTKKVYYVKVGCFRIEFVD
jgi:putative methylase